VVHDDDELLYDGEVAPDLRPSNRRFWLIVAAFATTCVVILVALFANLPLVNSIARAQFELRYAESLAEQRFGSSGTFTQADAESLARLDDTLIYVDGDVESRRAGTVSVYATATVWAAAVQARPDACFFIKRSADHGLTYGSGVTCTGEAALAAELDSW
jgi:hypothetical protein